MVRKVRCTCTQCKGQSHVPQHTAKHAARDRRLESITSRHLPRETTSTRATPSPHTAAATSSPSSLPDDDDAMDVAPDFYEVYSSGLSEHVNRSGSTAEATPITEVGEDQDTPEEYVPISRDDWEDPAAAHEEDADATPDTATPDYPIIPIELDAFVQIDEDPFRYDPTTTTPSQASGVQTPHMAVYLAYVLVFWLHAQCHLPFRACNAVLVCLGVIFRLIGLSLNPPMYETLPSVMNTLGANPTFQIAPVCPSCMQVYPPSTPLHALCTSCKIPLFLKKPSARVRTGGTSPNPLRPALQFPYKSLEEQLAAMLAVPGIEDVIEQSLNKMKSRVPGKYTNVFDRRICRELRAPDDSKFFSPAPEVIDSGELRVAVSLGVDWFSYLRSLIAPSHTSCPMSYSVMSLPPHLRYRTSNLLLAGIMPGPKEADVDQVHYFMRVLVNELLRLWRDGVVIKTPKYPNGRLVRVILIAVVCDKPAAHKLGGFGSHAHQYFCTQCWVTQDDKALPTSFCKGAFRARTNAEHRRLQREYLACRTKKERAEFVKKHATRWSELHRLPYFDICRMIVIDPMHNLFLGLVKTHFYHIWVQLNVLRKTKELRRLHTILTEIKLPVKLGRLPSLIGEPAGGSLTADQWLVFATVVAPLAIPKIWEEFLVDNDGGDPAAALRRRTQALAETVAAKKAAAAEARQQHQKSDRPKRTRKQTQKALEADIDPDDNNGIETGAVENIEDNYNEHGRTTSARKGKKSNNAVGEDEAIDEATPCNLHAKDPGNFMKLSVALRILIARTVQEPDLQLADKLLRQYCAELVEIYGPSVIRPNHHYAIHTVESVRDYGPLHEFWTFLFERMNKVLKSYKTSNHSGGELETSFFREFHRTVQASRLLGHGASSGAPAALQECVQAMYNATEDDRGTVQALSRELDAAVEDEGVHFQMSSRAEYMIMPRDLYYTVLNYMSKRGFHVHSDASLAPSPSSVALPSRATFFDHVTILNTRYSALHRSRSSAETLLAARVAQDGRLWIGELLDIFVIDHPVLCRHWFGHMRWLEPVTFDLSDTYWKQFAVLHVNVWKANEYLPPGGTPAVRAVPSSIIDLGDIVCAAIRFETTVHGEPSWITVLQDRNGTVPPQWPENPITL